MIVAKARAFAFRFTARSMRIFDEFSTRRGQLRNLGLLLAVLTFTGGLIIALQADPTLFEQLYIAPFVVLVGLAIPLTAGLNAGEFQLMAAMAGKRVSWTRAYEICAYTSAANMLFLPAGLATRAAALRMHGVGLKLGGGLILTFMALWAGTAFLYSGGAILILGHLQIGAAFVAVGAVLTTASIALLGRVGSGWKLRLAALTVKCGQLALEAFRMCLAAWALGLGIDFGEASIFSVSSVVGFAVAIVPAGLGVAEMIAAVLSPLAGIDPAQGFVMAAVSRIATMLGLLVITAVIAGVTWISPRGS